jgi:hypothetical protein
VCAERETERQRERERDSERERMREREGETAEAGDLPGHLQVGHLQVGTKRARDSGKFLEKGTYKFPGRREEGCSMLGHWLSSRRTRR